jgi:hypothetical protein
MDGQQDLARSGNRYTDKTGCECGMMIMMIVLLWACSYGVPQGMGRDVVDSIYSHRMVLNSASGVLRMP